MAGKRENKAQKKREKQKKKRNEARKARASRTGRNTRAAEWPLSESWVSGNWHEVGATVQCMLTRTHPSGRMAAAVFEVDLAERGVVTADVLTDAHPAEIQQQLSRRSTDLTAMQVCEPELVLKIVREGRRHGEAQGHSQPADIQTAMALFPDVDADVCSHAIHTGKATASGTGESAASGGLWDSFKKRIGLG